MSNKIPVIFQIGWNACIHCGACVAICPQEAGFISDFDTIAVGRPCDIACMLCEDICPVSTITHEEAGNPVTYVNQGFNQDQNGAMRSPF